MTGSKNGESTTRTTWTVERGEAFHSDDPGRQAGVGGTSSHDGIVSLGVAGKIGQTANCPITITGGILTQLIKQVEGQLGTAKYQVQNAEACLDWYQREKDEHQRRMQELEDQLGSLRDLESELQKQLEQPEGDESEELSEK